MEAVVAGETLADAPEVRRDIRFEGGRTEKSALTSHLVVLQKFSCLGRGERRSVRTRWMNKRQRCRNLKII